MSEVDMRRRDHCLNGAQTDATGSSRCEPSVIKTDRQAGLGESLLCRCRTAERESRMRGTFSSSRMLSGDCC